MRILIDRFSTFFQFLEIHQKPISFHKIFVTFGSFQKFRRKTIPLHCHYFDWLFFFLLFLVIFFNTLLVVIIGLIFLILAILSRHRLVIFTGLINPILAILGHHRLVAFNGFVNLIFYHFGQPYF